MRALAVLAGAALALAAAPPAGAADARLTEIGSFHSPVHVASPPEDASRIFVVERSGRVRLVEDGRVLRRPFLDIRRDVRSGNEQGLLSIAFAPDYADSGLFYVFYSDRGGDARVREFRRSTERTARRSSGRTVLRIEHSRHPNHYGGQLQFGPDRLLYISTGDGGGAGNPLGTAQRRSSLLGKILRIDPRRRGRSAYRIPRTNPFRRAGERREIYAYGLRNPWRFSFDRVRGDLVLGDVGQDRFEEISFMRRGRARGANFGWNVFEGRSRFRGGSAPGHVPPVFQGAHSAGWCSIIAGYVVRDPRLPRLRGRFVYGDFCRPRLDSALLRSGRARSRRGTGLRVDFPSGFGEDAEARIYVASLRGPVYRLDPR